MSKLTSRTWWRDAAIRAVYTALAIVVPYLGGSLIADIPWVAVVSAAVLGVVLSFATSLTGLPEAQGVDLPWWLAALERVGKTFGQTLAAGIGTAVFVTDIDWSVVLQTSVIAAFVSLLRLILATLPADPTTHVLVATPTEDYADTATRAEYRDAPEQEG